MSNLDDGFRANWDGPPRLPGPHGTDGRRVSRGAGAGSRIEKADAQVPVVAENDARLATARVEYDAGGTKMAGYLARLKGGQRRPAVLVIHENRGLTAHIQDVTRRAAVEGFLAFGFDVLSPQGGTPADQEQAGKMFGSLNADETVARLAATVRFLASHPESTGKVGVVGFCWGGGMVNSVGGGGDVAQRWGRVLWPAASGGGRAEGHRAADAALRGARRADQRGDS